MEWDQGGMSLAALLFHFARTRFYFHGACIKLNWSRSDWLLLFLSPLFFFSYLSCNAEQAGKRAGVYSFFFSSGLKSSLFVVLVGIFSGFFFFLLGTQNRDERRKHHSFHKSEHGRRRKGLWETCKYGGKLTPLLKHIMGARPGRLGWMDLRPWLTDWQT